MRGSARPIGLQSEVMLSLALVMGLATAVLAWVFWTHQETMLRRVIGAALFAEVHAPAPQLRSLYPGTRWWWLDPDDALAAGSNATPPDQELLALAREARNRDAPLLRTGTLGEPIRFAAPVGAQGRVAAARLPVEVSHALRVLPMAVFATLAIGNLSVFTCVGAWLLRRRVGLPLQQLSAGARRIAEGEAGLRVDVVGPVETVALARAFNEMTEALEGRTRDLEKAVVDLRDVNRELRETRAGLDRAERLASVGTLAAGVAHEVGNPMGAMLTFLELAERDGQLTPASREMLEKARAQGERVRAILRQLLDFSRPSQPVCEQIDLAALAQETVALLRPQPGFCEVALEVCCDPETPRAIGDTGIVRQILLNLLLNAGHAVRDVAEPRIRVTVRPAVLARRGDDVGEVGSRVDAVECEVADSGHGISAEDRERIFAPFFTTKDPGEGTGLGLSTAARQAEEMGGVVELARVTAPLRTAFVLRLAAAVPEVECAPGQSDPRNRVRGAQDIS